jgi:hypothetical protein
MNLINGEILGTDDVHDWLSSTAELEVNQYYDDLVEDFNIEEAKTPKQKSTKNRFTSVSDIEDLRNHALSAIRNTGAIGSMSIDSMPIITTEGITDIVSDVLQSITPRTVSVRDFLKREEERVKTLGNNYTIDLELSEVIDDIASSILIVEAITKGADANYQTQIDGIPFGANNFLNKAFKEKGLNIELMEIAPNAISVVLGKLLDIKAKLKFFIDLDINNRGAVITQEKQLSLLLNHRKLQSVQSLLEKENAPQSFKDAFAGTNVSLTSDILTISDDDRFISTGIDYRNQLLDFERKFSDLWKSSSGEQKVELVQWILANYRADLHSDASNLSTKELTEANAEGKQPTLFLDKDLILYLMNVSFGNTDIINSAYKKYVEANEKMAPFDSQEEVATTILRFLLNENPEDVDL